MSNEYALGHADHELRRLTEQGKFFGELTEQLLRGAGIGAGMRVLDVGCGAGDVSLLAASLVGPGGAVVGVDRSPEAIALANRRATAAGLKDISFVVQDLAELETSARFDVLIGRLVLMYFPQPAALLRRLLELTVTGATVAFHEFDACAATSEPHVPLYERTIARVTATLQGVRADPRTGLRLPQIFQEAGLPTPYTIAHTRIGTGADSGVFAQVAAVTRTLLPAMEKLGIATAAEVDVDTLAVRLQRAVQAENATVTAPLFIGAWTRK